MSPHTNRRVTTWTLLAMMCLVAAHAAAQEKPEPVEPEIAPASQEAERAIQGFKVPTDLDVRLFAAEPQLANPVAFDIDHQGRFWICETFRQNQGVTDNRGHDQAWLNDDLAAQSVADRAAYYRKHLGDKAIEYMLQDDRIRLVEDSDGDGRADKATVFADHFNDLVEGTGAGVLARGGNVYYTNIPYLWLLKDEDGDGQADVRQPLHYGYGVRTAFRGHDMHGLIVGPDGKLYFSIGDRGYNVETPDGKFVDPESGAVFRCNLDGSKLEVVHTGLRNPQELAFDDYGNLFTGDNNSDSGDQARFVYIVEGGDSGWRMSYQYLPDRGPFNREHLWKPYQSPGAASPLHVGDSLRDSQSPRLGETRLREETEKRPATPAYIVPPILNLADGPSGLAYYPGTGLPAHYNDRFFLCDFRGTPVNSGVRTFRVQPAGAFFEVIDQEQSIWSILATDVAFGVDGAVYVSDWVDGWNGTGKGRLYAFYDSEADQDGIQQVAELLSGGITKREPAELAQLLAHNDQRVRLEAQFALTARGEVDLLERTALDEGAKLLARLHAIWGLGQLAEAGSVSPSVWNVLVAASGDEEAEVRSQAVKVLGQQRYAAAFDLLVGALQDASPRVRYFAALGLGRLNRSEAISPLLALLADNADRDPLLRHAGIMGLAGSGTPEQLLAAAGHVSSAARLGVLAAMRRHASSQITHFLNDTDVELVTEAARAIHDLPIVDAMPMLAEVPISGATPEALAHRVLNANYRLGGAQGAAVIARYAADSTAPDGLRREAVEMLANWQSPSPRDRILGMWRPLDERDSDAARDALAPVLADIFNQGSSELRAVVGETAARLQLKEAAPYLLAMVTDADLPSAARSQALQSLASIDAERAAAVIPAMLQDSDPTVRTTALRVLAAVDPGQALPLLEQAVNGDEQIERQGALATLAKLDHPQADKILSAALDKLQAGEIPLDTQLDVLEAARIQDNADLRAKLQAYEQSVPTDDPLAPHRVALAGGNAEAGRKIFFERTEVSCLRCHEIGETGGEVGPDLTQIGSQKTREYLLESIVAPSKTIAEGFETVVVIDDRGRIVSGVLKKETDEQLQLMTPEEKLITVDKSTIDERTTGQSAMPADLIEHLSPADLRNLIEFLAGLNAPAEEAGHRR